MSKNSPIQLNTFGIALYMSMELSAAKWKLGFADQLGRNPRVRTINAGDLESLKAEIDQAKKVFGLAPDAPVVSCYEAGRDGFWLHRCLVLLDIESHIVEPASIQTNRRRRRAKTDRIDAQMIVAALMRYKAGDRFACRMIRIPSVGAEDARHLNRELRTLKAERTAHTNRMKALLVTQGINDVKIDRMFLRHLARAKAAQGEPLGEQLKARLIREFDRVALVTEQIRELQMYQAKLIREAAQEKACIQTHRDRTAFIATRIGMLKGLGPVTSWTLSSEIYSWRDSTNRRQLAALVGLVPTPYASGGDERECGISKSGRGELRVLMIEIAWLWLEFQPQSELAKWYVRRFDDGTKRNRKIGIVALARKLLVAINKYIHEGEIPAGADLKTQPAFRYLPSLRTPNRTPGGPLHKISA